MLLRKVQSKLTESGLSAPELGHLRDMCAATMAKASQGEGNSMWTPAKDAYLMHQTLPHDTGAVVVKVLQLVRRHLALQSYVNSMGTPRRKHRAARSYGWEMGEENACPLVHLGYIVVGSRPRSVLWSQLAPSRWMSDYANRPDKIRELLANASNTRQKLKAKNHAPVQQQATKKSLQTRTPSARRASAWMKHWLHYTALKNFERRSRLYLARASPSSQEAYQLKLYLDTKLKSAMGGVRASMRRTIVAAWAHSRHDEAKIYLDKASQYAQQLVKRSERACRAWSRRARRDLPDGDGGLDAYRRHYARWRLGSNLPVLLEVFLVVGDWGLIMGPERALPLAFANVSLWWWTRYHWKRQPPKEKSNGTVPHVHTARAAHKRMSRL